MGVFLFKHLHMTKQITNNGTWGLHIMDTPSGKYTYVGSVPAALTIERTNNLGLPYNSTPSFDTIEAAEAYLKGRVTNIVYNGIEYTPEHITAMREWIKDCQWREDYEPNEIDELSPLTVLKGIESHFDGGLIEFLLTV